MKASCGDKFSEVPGRSAAAERRALNGALAGGQRYVTKRHRWRGGVGGGVGTFARRRTKYASCQACRARPFQVLTAIPLGAKGERSSVAQGDGERFGGGRGRGEGAGGRGRGLPEVACSEVCVRAPETKP